MQNLYLKIKKIISSLYFALLVFPSLAFAKGLVPCGGATEPKCDFNQLIVLVQKVINLALTIAPMLAAVAFAVAGFYYVTAAGDTGKIKQAHDIAIAGAVGLIIVLIAWILVKTIITTLGGGEAFMLLSK